VIRAAPFLFIFCLLASCFVQHKTAYKKMKWFGDTTHRGGWTQEMLDSIGLKLVKNATVPYHFRYSVGQRVVDVWSADMLQYHGRVTCFTTGNRKSREFFYGMNFPVADSVATAIAIELRKRDVFEMPDIFTEAKEPFDCADCTFESYQCMTAGGYRLKTYWAEWPGHKGPFKSSAAKVDSMNKFIESGAEVDEKFDEFISLLPNGTYQDGIIQRMKIAEE
jgi:hypothetical protein